MSLKLNQQNKERMDRVLDYIDHNLDAPFALDELCSVANFSKYHFHRQFSEFAGMTVFKFISRKRMKRAAYQLMFRGEVSITNIAFDAGFENPEAFSKAFKRENGVSPLKFRKDNSQVGKLDLLQTFKKESEKMMNIKTVEFPRLRVAAFEHKGSPKTVMQSVQKFIEWRKVNNLPPSRSRTFNFMYDDPEITRPENYRMDICAELKGSLKLNSKGIVEKEIPACQCAFIRHVGPWETLDECLRYLYREWLPNNNREPLDFPIFLERVNFFPDVSEHELITDIFLPLK